MRRRARDRSGVRGVCDISMSARIDYAAFAIAWNAADTPKQLMERYAIKKAALYQRAKRASELGHTLKNLGGRISQSEFVAAWVSAASLADVAQKLDLTEGSAKSIAVAMRKRGIELPRMRRLNHAYVAGILDANGYIHIRQRTDDGRTWKQFNVRITNDYPAVLAYIQAHYGGSVFAGAPNILEWYDRAKIRRLLQDALPWLIAVREQVVAMLAEIESTQYGKIP